MTKKLALVASLLGISLAASFAEATPITSVIIPSIDYGLIAPVQGPLVAGPLDDVFHVALPPPASVGKISSSVYFDGSVYTYAFRVTPTTPSGLSEVSTGFSVAGFTGEAGYSFADAAAAGGIVFTVFLDGDGTLDYEVSSPGLVWGKGDPVTLFFRSTIAPVKGTYGAIDKAAGEAVGFGPKPVPEPSPLLLLGSGLVGLGALRRRIRR